MVDWIVVVLITSVEDTEDVSEVLEVGSEICPKINRNILQRNKIETQ